MDRTFGERLQTALSAAKKSRASLAKVLRNPKGEQGISASAVGQIINGQSNAMTAENTVRAARFLNVSAYWLATGEGPMHDTPRLRAVPVDLHVAEPPPSYWTARDVLEKLGELLSNVPPAMRPAFGDVLGGWAADGGVPSRIDALLALSALSSKQPARG